MRANNTTRQTDEEIARNAATQMLVNFAGQTFTREYAVMSEQIILAEIKKAKK